MNSLDQPLLSLAFQHVDDSMLREIARADYGMDDEAHLQALRAIKAGAIPAPMQWEPKEVLELTRWSEPEGPPWIQGTTGERGHWKRLFSCAVLIRCAAEPENDDRFLGEDSTIIQLVDSALKLGQESSLAALQFFCWRTGYRNFDQSDNPLMTIAKLVLSVSLGQCDAEMANQLIAATHSDDTEALTLCELINESQSAWTWKDVVRRILIQPKNVCQEIREFALALMDNGKTA